MTDSELYPWAGDFSTGDLNSPIAIVTLAEDLEFDPDKVAIWGPMRTENLGIEKVVANTISNPNIRYLFVCGEEIKGHKSGRSLIALWKNGIDKRGKIKKAPGAVPYIENLSSEAVERFQNQIEVVDKIGITCEREIEAHIADYIKKEPGSFEKPYIAIKIEKKEKSIIDTDFALHSSLKVSVWGKISNIEEEVK